MERPLPKERSRPALCPKRAQTCDKTVTCSREFGAQTEQPSHLAPRRDNPRHPPSNSPHVYDKAVAGLALQLRAESRDVRVEGPRAREGAVAPDVAQELVLREDAVGIGSERG